MLNFIDGNWVDICSLLISAAYVFVAHRRGKLSKLVSKDAGILFANGVSLFPLVLLALTSFSSASLQALLTSNKLILSVAGVVALLAILETD